MKCPMCGGDGITDKFTPNVGRCIKCNGSGEIEPTNEEWLHSLNTEQLAECLTNISFNTGYDSYNIVLRKIIEWLKQPHTQGETK